LRYKHEFSGERWQGNADISVGPLADGCSMYSARLGAASHNNQTIFKVCDLMTESTKVRSKTFFALLVVAAVAGSLRFARAEESTATKDDKTIVPAITRPSKELKLSFQSPGVVKDVPVNEGDHVKAGQVLAQQDDRADEAAYQATKLEAESTAKIDVYTVTKATKEVQLKRKQLLLAQHNASESEVEEAQLDVDQANAQIILSKLEHDQKGFEAKEKEVKLELMKLVAPFDGIVQQINVRHGEMADPQSRDGAIVVVTNDPLWVEMHIPTTQALQLHLQQALKVRLESDKDWRDAKITYFAPEADAASGTQKVRLELPNPTGQWSGLHADVKLPDNVAAVASN
jgi:RND family efflux transporter MFP subunit